MFPSWDSARMAMSCSERWTFFQRWNTDGRPGSLGQSAIKPWYISTSCIHTMEFGIHPTKFRYISAILTVHTEGCEQLLHNVFPCDYHPVYGENSQNIYNVFKSFFPLHGHLERGLTHTFYGTCQRVASTLHWAIWVANVSGLRKAYVPYNSPWDITNIVLENWSVHEGYM